MVTMLTIHALCVVLLTTFVNGNADTSEACPVSPPCSCYGNKIVCSDSNLVDVPLIRKVNVTYPGWSVDISQNNISIIPSHVFQNITLLEFIASRNNISVIDDHAFFGSENVLDGIFIQFNRLTDVPTPIVKASTLTMLSIHDNPIPKLSENTVLNLSPSLQFLDVGSPEMTLWPSSLEKLKSKVRLTLYRLPMTTLPQNAFSGMDNLISSLDFESMNFSQLPNSLGSLNSMTDLSIVDSVYLTSQGIPKNMFQGMTNLTSFSIDNCSLTEMPNMAGLVNLDNFGVNDNPVSVWDVTTLPDQPVIKSVSFNNNSFTSVPSTLSRIPSLQQITMTYNPITEVRDTDFRGLRKLGEIYFENNPIAKVSDGAFSDNFALRYLVLASARLTTVPRAVQNIPALKLLRLDGNDLNCTCASIGWMKDWNGLKSAIVVGTCTNLKNTTLSAYVQSLLPKCPNESE